MPAGSPAARIGQESSGMKLNKENLGKTTAQALMYNNTGGGSGSGCLLLCLKC